MLVSLLGLVSCPASFLRPLRKGSGHQLANSWLCDVSFQDSSNDQSDFFSHVTVTPRSAMASSGSFSRGAALAAMVVATERLVYAKLSAEQKEAVLHILSGQDVLVSLPTGARKSLCYFIFTYMF